MFFFTLRPFQPPNQYKYHGFRPRIHVFKYESTMRLGTLSVSESIKHLSTGKSPICLWNEHEQGRYDKDESRMNNLDSRSPCKRRRGPGTAHTRQKIPRPPSGRPARHCWLRWPTGTGSLSAAAPSANNSFLYVDVRFTRRRKSHYSLFRN